jgi:hypothetical protein
MRAMIIEIGLEIEELAFEIGACPERGTVQALAAEGADLKGVVEHSAKGEAVDGAGVQAEPHDPTSVLIHDDQNPASTQHRRFAAKEVRAPETVLHLTEECQPRRTAGVRLG